LKKKKTCRILNETVVQLTEERIGQSYLSIYILLFCFVTYPSMAILFDLQFLIVVLLAATTVLLGEQTFSAPGACRALCKPIAKPLMVGLKNSSSSTYEYWNKTILS